MVALCGGGWLLSGLWFVVRVGLLGWFMQFVVLGCFVLLEEGRGGYNRFNRFKRFGRVSYAYYFCKKKIWINVIILIVKKY